MSTQPSTLLQYFDSLTTEDQSTFLAFAKSHHVARFAAVDARDGFSAVGDSEPGPAVVTPFVDVTNQPNLSEQARNVRADKGQRLSDERMRCKAEIAVTHAGFNSGDTITTFDRCVNRSGGPRSKFLCQEHAK